MCKEINNNKIVLPPKDEFIHGKKYYGRKKDNLVDISEPPRRPEKNFYDPCNPSGYYEKW
jgi:hypothetical protein